MDGYGGLHAVDLAHAALRALAGADGFLVRHADRDLRALHRWVTGYVAGGGAIVRPLRTQTGAFAWAACRAVACGMFATATSIGMLAIGRLLPGVAVGMIVSAGMAAIDGVYRTDHHLTIAKVQTTPERDPNEVVNAHVRRLEALRRACIVERVTEGVWRVPADLPERGRQYDAQRLGGMSVELRSHLPIERQTRVIGATRTVRTKGSEPFTVLDYWG